MKRTIFLFFLIFFVFSLSAEIIIDEDFSGNFPPTGWTTTSTSGQINWAQGSGNNAGGTSPEAQFSWSPSTVATQRLISLPVNTVGATELDLEFKHNVNHYSGLYELRVETTSDGVIWNIVTIFPAANLPATTENLVITTPDVGSPTFQVAWVFDGNSFNINYWYVDDVVLSGTLITYDNDLAAIEINGSTIVNAGNTENYEISVKNVGYNPQNSYTVKLMREGGEELSSLDITQTIQPDEIVIHNLVWNISPDEPPAVTYLYGEVILEGDENSLNDITGNLEVEIFPPGIIEITVGNGTENNNRTPVSFQYLNSLTEILYFQDELNNITGMITAITYYSNFTSPLMSKPTAIWMGETTLSNLTAGYIPSTQLTQVFDGNVIYPSGQNDISIEFTTPYFYSGDNLVVMVHRPMDTQNYGATDYFYHDETLEHIDRTRYQRDDYMVLNPASPPPPDSSFAFEKFANTTFTFYLGPMGDVEGYVYDDQGVPLEGAEVLIEEIQTVTYTNDQGFYHFGNILAGIYNFTASLYGYSPQTIQAEVFENEVTIIDFNLIPLGIVSVSGHVVGSDYPDIGLVGAYVTLTGFANYETYTNQDGDFLIEGVYTNVTYDLGISYEGYDNYINEVQVFGVNLDLGTLVLNEIAYPPGNVQAVQNELGTEVYLSWNSPGQGGGEFRYDDGLLESQIGFSATPANGVFGAVHPNIAIIQEVTWYLSSIYGTHSHVKIFIFGLDSDGNPDSDLLLHESALLPNIDDEWNTYILVEQVDASEGFLIGINTPNEYTSLGLDDGVGEPWVFQSGTQMCIMNWSSGTDEWADIGNWGPQFQKNMMIRAYGIDFGHTRSYAEPERYIEIGNKINVHSDTKLINQFNISCNREFEFYNVYRFFSWQHSNPNNWDLIATGVIDTFYTDTSWASLPNDIYQFAVKSIHTNGIESLPAFSPFVEKTLANSEPEPVCIYRTSLQRNYPNPFNPTTTISFSLAKDAKDTNITIYNIKGQKVKEFKIENLKFKINKVDWDGTDENNQPVSSGIYLYRLNVNGKTVASRKMILIK